MSIASSTLPLTIPQDSQRNLSNVISKRQKKNHGQAVNMGIQGAHKIPEAWPETLFPYNHNKFTWTE